MITKYGWIAFNRADEKVHTSEIWFDSPGRTTNVIVQFNEEGRVDLDDPTAIGLFFQQDLSNERVRRLSEKVIRLEDEIEQLKKSLEEYERESQSKKVARLLMKDEEV
jgi:hypothetical protein